MDQKLLDSLKKAQQKVESSGIKDPELKKIAFSKAVDFYLYGQNTTTENKKSPSHTNETRKNEFWSVLSESSGVEEIRMKDVYTYKEKDEQILLVVSVPGDTKADKQRNLAALVLLAYHEGLNLDWVPANYLAEAAKHSNLYDKTNFAKYIRSNGWFRSQGVKKGVKYRLAADGINYARGMLREISN